MYEQCPSCGGQRVPDDPALLSAYEHRADCALQLAERAQLDRDRRKAARTSRVIRWRACTTTERALVAASGVDVPPTEPMFVRYELASHDLLLRLFPRAGLVAIDAVSL